MKGVEQAALMAAAQVGTLTANAHRWGGASVGPTLGPHWPQQGVRVSKGSDIRGNRTEDQTVKVTGNQARWEWLEIRRGIEKAGSLQLSQLYWPGAPRCRRLGGFPSR